MNMKTMHSHFKKWPTLCGLPVLFLFGTFTTATAQTAATQSPSQNGANTGSNQDRDITRRELANFDEFLDAHRETAEQVRKDPSLLDNKQFLKDHPVLQTYLWNHPGVREEVKENPTAFTQAENRYERAEDTAAREKLASFDQFLDKHREIAEQVRRNPSLLDDPQFLKNHPDLQTYLQDHAGVRNELKNNPSAFMRQEDRFERVEDATDRDTARGKIASFDQFLDAHREVAEQLRRNPSLLDDQQFLKDHPALQAYLQDHPGIRNEARSNPSVLMRQEDRYDRREAEAFGRDPDSGPRHFGEFLEEHREISRDLSKDASLVKRDEYVHNHPALQAYLSSHPEVREQLMADPQGFLKSSQQFTAKTPSTVKTTTAPTTAEKPKP